LEDSLEQDVQSQEAKSTKCILPWIHQHGDIEGNYAPCCFTLAHRNNFFGFGTSPLEAFNSNNMKSIRLKMLENERPEECKVCYSWEDNGVESHRQRMNSMYSDYSSLYDTTNPDGSLNTPPIYLDFRFGNLCNFSCRMCGSYASSSWAKEEKHSGSLSKDSPNHYDHWTNNDKFWRDIDKIKKYIKVLYFAGGEPFVQEGHYKMLSLFVESGLSKQISLAYNTNLSYNGSFKGFDLEDLWTNFKKVELWPSIEGFGERAEYGRKGLDLDLFKKNSIKFSKYINTYSLVSSVYSITSNLELITWLKSINKSFSITNLENRDFHSTTIFSKEVKKDIISTYKQFLNNQNILSDHEVKSIIASLKHMMSRDDSHLSKKFKDFNTKSDAFRHESFTETFPELAEWYKSI
jgi:organic radical activating enzyme